MKDLVLLIFAVALYNIAVKQGHNIFFVWEMALDWQEAMQ